MGSCCWGILSQRGRGCIWEDDSVPEPSTRKGSIRRRIGVLDGIEYR